MKKNLKPVFVQARPLPFALLKAAEEEYDSLMAKDVLEAVKCREWASPILPVLKEDGIVKIAGDFSMSVDPQLKIG